MEVQVEEEKQTGYGESLDDCFTQTDKIAKDTANIEELSAKLKPIKKIILSTIGRENERAQDQYVDIMKRIKEFIRKAIDGLKRLNMEIKTAKVNSTEFRIKKAQYSHLTANLRRVIMDCNTAEVEYQEELKRIIKIRLKTIGSDTSQLTEDQLEEMVESNDIVFAQDLLVDMVSKKEDLKEIEERKKELLKLEKNIIELEEMFNDLKVLMLLVEEQNKGELWDHIETHVEEAADYVDKNEGSTATVVRLRSRGIKGVCCVIN